MGTGGKRKRLVALRERLQVLRSHFENIQLIYCVENVDTLLNKLERNKFLESSDIAGLEDNLARELKGRVFLSVASERQVYFREPLKAWESVTQTFPNSQEDIEEMNKCYALSRYTAAVFHSLLVVEHGLIKLGNEIGVDDPKAGWDATYKRLAVLLSNRASIPAELEFNFLEQTKARLDSMKLAWRNKVNHAAGKLLVEKTGFTDVSAEEVIVACRSFMRHLAEGLPKAQA